MRDMNVTVTVIGNRRLRMVTHLDMGPADEDALIAGMVAIARSPTISRSGAYGTEDPQAAARPASENSRFRPACLDCNRPVEYRDSTTATHLAQSLY
jgi:hypothetical protein